MSRFILVALLGVGGLTGCGNPCAQICQPMADYARDCGYDVNSSFVLDCKSANSGEVSAETADVCREYSNPQKLREWWTCDDLAENMTEIAGE